MPDQPFESLLSQWERPRGYHGLILRRTMRSAYFSGSTPTNCATHTLYNNSQQNDVLVVRSVDFGATAVQLANGLLNTTLLGTH